MAESELKDLRANSPKTGTPEDSKRLADDLVSHRRLTPFQADMLLLGTSTGLVYGNYVVLDKLGQGGMGLVYEAEHRRMHRRVALKVMSPKALKSEESVKRFHREVQAAARLTHPNIVAAYDADEAHGAHFLVMELVTGSDLSARVKKHGPLPVAEAVGYVIQAARGLDHAHNAGIVHRDIKPANLLLDNEGTVKVLDLGMARLDESLALVSSAAATITQTGSIMGTIDFMSPEQALDTRHADRRADIYSLGCSLFYLLTARPLFPADTMMKKLLAHREHPIPSLRAIRADVSQELDSVFTRMVAKRPEDRHQTMIDVIRDLEQAGDFADGAAHPPSRASSVAHHSTLAPDDWRGAGGNAETQVVAKPLAGLAVLIPGAETRKQEVTTREPSAKPEVETRRLSRRQWFALALSTGLLVLLAVVPWFASEHDGRRFAKVDDGRRDAPVRAGRSGRGEDSKFTALAWQNRRLTPADGWIDLSAAIDTKRDVVFGTWQQDGDILTGSDSARDSIAARLILSCRPSSGYELSFRLRRIAGDTGVTVILPVGARSVALVLSGFPDLPGETAPLTGLHLLDGKALPLSPERVRGPKLESGRAYQVKVRVAVKEGTGMIGLELDDDRILNWAGNIDRLEVALLFHIPDARYLGLGVFNAAVEIHDLEFRVTEGEASIGQRPATLPMNANPG